MTTVSKPQPMDPENLSRFDRRLRHRKRIIRTFEARINQDRSVSERMADFMTRKLGSMTFLGLNASVFCTWIAVNLGTLPGVAIFDPFPFGLLTMCVSLEAIFLAIIVLLSQNRAAQVDDLRAEIELYINTTAEAEITKIIELQMMILKVHNIDVSQDRDLQEMLVPTNTSTVEKQFKKEIYY